MTTENQTNLAEIPLNLLVASPENARRTGRNVGIEELAATIHANSERNRPRFRNDFAHHSDLMSPTVRG